MAMLRAAEEELSLRSEQLNLTTEMLRATEGELQRKDEQLTLTMAMLRRAEGEPRRSRSVGKAQAADAVACGRRGWLCDEDDVSF